MQGRVPILLNAQICREFYSAYLYLKMSIYYADEGLDGFASWFRIQAQEERDHALLFIDYMQQNEMEISLKSIDEPSGEFTSFSSPLLLTLQHEKFCTQKINEIYAAAEQEQDFRTTQFLDWFVSEQAEEEATATDLIKRMKLFGDGMSLYMMDAEMKTRVYTPPTLALG